jgi:hypothetical protein
MEQHVRYIQFVIDSLAKMTTVKYNELKYIVFIIYLFKNIINEKYI